MHTEITKPELTLMLLLWFGNYCLPVCGLMLLLSDSHFELIHPEEEQIDSSELSCCTVKEEQSIVMVLFQVLHILRF